LGRFVRGDVVVVPFPFFARVGFKPRPALVVAHWDFLAYTHYLLCAVSSAAADDKTSLELRTIDFATGSLNRPSFARPAYLFSVDESLIERKKAALKPGRVADVAAKIIGLIQP